MVRKVVHIRPDGSLTGTVEDDSGQAVPLSDHEAKAIAAAVPAETREGQTINVHLHTERAPGDYLWRRKPKPADETKQIAPPSAPSAEFSEQVRDTLSELRDRTELPDLPAMPAAESITGERAFNLKEVLQAADDEPGTVLQPTNVPPNLDDAELRRRGLAQINDAVVTVSRKLAEGQIRYEQALMVENERIESMQQLQLEAGILGIEVKELARRIIAERKVAERRTAFVHATRARAEVDIKAATGDGIGAIVDGAVVAILDDANMVDE